MTLVNPVFPNLGERWLEVKGIARCRIWYPSGQVLVVVSELFEVHLGVKFVSGLSWMPVTLRYVIKIREFAKFVVGLGEKVSATDIEESMRVGVDTSHGGKQLGLLWEEEG